MQLFVGVLMGRYLTISIFGKYAQIWSGVYNKLLGRLDKLHDGKGNYSISQFWMQFNNSFKGLTVGATTEGYYPFGARVIR